MVCFRGAHFEAGIILVCARWYLAYPLSYRHIEEIMKERGIEVDHSTLPRWVLKYTPPMSDQTFLAFIMHQFKVTPIPPEKICFEITETAAIANLIVATHFITALKARGCYFALDDFGSGLSSFAYLKTLPVDFLKIDGTFIKDITDDPTSYAIVKSINEIGQIMGKRTIAEFVENERILEKLRQVGVDYTQGYLIGRLIPPKDLP